MAKIETTEERGQIAACTEVLAGLRFDNDLIQQLLREDIMRESVVYQRILREGRQEGLRTSILSVLESRFGSVPGNLDEHLILLTPEQLQFLLGQAATCGTLEEFITQLRASG